MLEQKCWLIPICLAVMIIDLIVHIYKTPCRFVVLWLVLVLCWLVWFIWIMFHTIWRHRVIYLVVGLLHPYYISRTCMSFFCGESLERTHTQLFPSQRSASLWLPPVPSCHAISLALSRKMAWPINDWHKWLRIMFLTFWEQRWVGAV